MEGEETSLPDKTEEQEGGVVRSSSTHVDSEIRQRRLERLHSMPTTLQQSLSPLAEEVKTGDKQSPVGEGGDDTSEV